MKRTFKYYRIMWLRHDLSSGISVFLIALPLCMGVALASNAPIYAGILSGIIGGIIVALISKSPFAVSGPAAGLTTVVAAAITSLGDYKLFLLSVCIAGLFQILLAALKIGIIVNYFPSSVIKGMLAAIGIILISKQIPIALGYDQPDFWTSGFLEVFASHNFLGNLSNFWAHVSFSTILITFLSLIILIYIKFTNNKKIKSFPAPFIIVCLGILLSFSLTHFTFGLPLKPSQMVEISSNIFSEMTFPDFSQLFSNFKIWENGLIIGSLASLETLLSINALDKLDAHNRITPVNRELFAQGIGNICCGLLGAIPITAVVVRGAANIDAGAKTKASAFTHGLLLLGAVLTIPFILNLIPFASLAAILLITGYNLTKPKLYKSMFTLGSNQYLPFILTIVMILLTNLLVGVCIGLLLSIYYIVQKNFKAEYKITKTHQGGIETYYIKLNSNVTFLNKVNLRKVLDDIPEYSILTIDGSDCNFIDYDILEIIGEYENKAHDKHIELHLSGIEKVETTTLHH
ncbi:MAG: SulP family inorganic anion transporter [Saprospiraceae bacterium]|nr:SulP family inorganic anion transporter [Saprospiraceae bacterium]